MKKGEKKLTPQQTDDIVNSYISNGSYSETGRIFDKSPRTIQNIVERYQLKYSEEYTKKFNLYLQKSEQTFIQQATNTINKSVEKIQEQLDNGDNTISQIATAMGILYDKRQLSQGKSTQNNAIVIQLKGDIKDLAE